MQISISIEPYLEVEKSKLTQYIDDIVRLSRNFKHSIDKVNLHFDYFKSNPEIFRLVQGYTSQIEIDLHLMQEPAPSVAGFRSVSIDVTNLKRTNLLSNINNIETSRRGLVLDLGCKVVGYENLIKNASYIIIMSVKCGKSGQTFQSSALQLIDEVRKLNPDAMLIVDGGVNENNINLLKDAGVDVAVVGNYAKKCYENGNLAIGINRLLHN